MPGYESPPVQMTALAHSISPRSVATAQTAPLSSVRMCLARSLSTLTPFLRASSARASAMSSALSDSGNTRFPRSVFRATPRPSNSAFVSEVPNLCMALCKKRPSPGMAEMNSRASQSLVTLQRPLPVIRSLRPSIL